MPAYVARWMHASGLLRGTCLEGPMDEYAEGLESDANTAVSEDEIEGLYSRFIFEAGLSGRWPKNSEAKLAIYVFFGVIERAGWFYGLVQH